MTLERKTIPFELKATSGDGSEFEGFASAFHNIDSAQEIVDDGAFDVKLAEFLQDGFIGGLNHDWDSPIGRPVSAEKQGRGLYCKGIISDTAHGRDVKVLLKDKVIRKLSIGYRTLEARQLKDASEVLSYWQEKGYTPSAEDMERAQKGARLLTKLHLYEFSPVTVPANMMADILAVKKQEKEAEFKAQHLGKYIESEMTVAALSRLHDALFYYVLYDALYSGDLSTAEKLDFIGAALDEFRTLTLRTVEAMLSASASGDEAMAAKEAADAIRAAFPNPETKTFPGVPADDAPYSEYSETVADAVEELARRTKDRAAMRAKAGRVLSESNRQTIRRCVDAMGEASTTLTELLEATEPKAAPETARKLRAESLRLYSRVIAAQ